MVPFPSENALWNPDLKSQRFKDADALLKGFSVKGRSRGGNADGIARPKDRRFYGRLCHKSTLSLEKPRMPQMQGIKGEAVVVYADPLAGRLPTGPNLWLGPREAI
jgi:hypothetical protein